MPDDLFTPTITKTPSSMEPPWRVDSLVYPAFFGGPLAATYLGAVNARRLGVSGRNLALILGAGIVALVAEVVALILLQGSAISIQRFVYSVAGIAVWGVVQWVQRRPFRIYQLRGGEPASLWGPGIAVVIGSALVQFILVTMVNAAVK